MMMNDMPAGVALMEAQQNTRALSSSTASPGELSGAALCLMVNTGGTPGTYTTRTAAQMIADSNLQIGQSWMILLANNQGTGVLTLAGGSGVTVTGTATVGTNVQRWFAAQVTAAGAIAIVGAALSNICAV